MRRGSAAAAIWMVATAACTPSARGRCAQDADCPTGSSCSTQGVCIAIAPSVALSLETPKDSGGWYSLAGADLRVAAQVTRGGTDPVSAELTVAGCAAASCAFAGSPAPGGFAFDVPRNVQASGSAAPLPFEVAVTDRAGNRGTAGGVLHIDGAPPQIGAFRVVAPAGVAGEDGQTWYVGSGPPSNTVEIAVPVQDVGAGLASVALSVNASDVKAGTPLAPAPATAADGTVHFQLPAYAVKKELALRFSITATDVMGHVATADGAVPVDGLAPVVGVPQVDYAGATPLDVCASGVDCGRQGGTRLLRDDTADVTFDVTDCGAGVAGPQTLTAGGRTVAAVEVPPSSASSCANGNRIHHFKATVDFGAARISAADPSGMVTVQLAVTASDLLANGSPAAGIATLSLWRWRQQLPGPATGSPVILPGAAIARGVAIGSPNDVTAFGRDGAQLWTTHVATGVGTDLALGPSGTIYVVSPGGSCSSSCLGTLTLIGPDGSLQCTGNVNTVSGSAFGAPPAITTVNTSPSTSVEAAVVAATTHVGGLFASPNLHVYTGCTPTSTVFTPGGNELLGVSAAPNRVFLAHAAGFTTQDQSGAGFNGGTQASVSPQVPVLAAPAVIDLQNAIFATGPGDQTIHRDSYKASCGLSGACWSTDTAFTPPAAASAGFATTPVFDGALIYAVDTAGFVHAWSQSTGTLAWTQPTGGGASAPVLLDTGLVLVVGADGSLKTMSQGTAGDLLVKVAPFSGTPAPPAIDAAGVAYLADGAGVVWAVNLPALPVQAGPMVWPRPGRDSCNSRNSGSSCR